MRRRPEPGVGRTRRMSDLHETVCAEVVLVCEATECDRPVYARGLCGRHYKQWRRHGHVQPETAPAECAVPGCGRRAVTRAWCHGRYLRWSRQGDVKADVPLARPMRDVCRVPDCGRGAHSAGHCRTHARRLQVHGDVLAGGPVRVHGAGGSLSHGYWKVSVPANERHLIPEGRTSELEHRLVMARQLGRAFAHRRGRPPRQRRPTGQPPRKSGVVVHRAAEGTTGGRQVGLCLRPDRPV